MAKNRKSIGNLITEFESSGKLTATEAQEFRDAPKWVIPFSDIASYLGGSVIFVGLVWIVVALMQDMSQATIDAALFVATGLTAFLSITLIKKGGKLITLGESVAAVSTMTFAFAIGLLLDIFNVHDDYILLIASAVALVIGIGLSTRTTFIGTIIIVAATQPFMAAVVSEFIPDTPVAPLLFAGSGSALIWFSLRNIGLRFVARAAGAISILIAAIGQPGFVSAEMVKVGAVVIDVGTTRVDDASKPKGWKLVGDVNFEEVAPKTSFISPVPGGVGPMTIAALLYNTLQSAEKKVFS